jgi:DNA-damage-inducible protein D
MPAGNLPQTGSLGFEGLKRTNDFGAEYWSARDLQPLLGYNHWRSFQNAVKKAITSCEQSGNDPRHHFARANRSPAARERFRRWMITSFHALRAT